jgi:hypothetical protein
VRDLPSKRVYRRINIGIIGDYGDALGVDRFGASAPNDFVMLGYGFTVENVCKRMLALLRYGIFGCGGTTRKHSSPLAATARN